MEFICDHFFQRLKNFIDRNIWKLMLIAYFYASKLFRPYLSKKNIWILLERGVDAQDNAWHMLNYIRKEHPEVNVRYAIDTKSKDFYANLSCHKDVVVEYDSFWYYMLLFNAKYIVSTHLHTYVHSYAIYEWIRKSKYRVKAKKVFLQHGVLQNDIPGLHFERQPDIDLFICGSKLESEYIQTLFGFPCDIAKYTGLARFDRLIECKTKKQILVMPTWRMFYQDFNQEEFENSAFFLSYSKLLTDEKLLSKLKESGYKLIFYNHFEFQKYNSSFKSICGENVSLVKFGEVSVQELLMDSCLLVTDYSSVYCDFVYMEKPVVFYQFDFDEFHKRHYGKPFINATDYGYASDSCTEIVEKIISYIDTSFQIESVYQQQLDILFPRRDAKNRERIYEEIIKQ